MSLLRTCFMVVVLATTIGFGEALAQAGAFREPRASSIEPGCQAKCIKPDQELEPITMGGAKEAMGARPRSFRGLPEAVARARQDDEALGA